MCVYRVAVVVVVVVATAAVLRPMGHGVIVCVCVLCAVRAAVYAVCSFERSLRF